MNVSLFTVLIVDGIDPTDDDGETLLPSIYTVKEVPFLKTAK